MKIRTCVLSKQVLDVVTSLDVDQLSLMHACVLNVSGFGIDVLPT